MTGSGPLAPIETQAAADPLAEGPPPPFAGLGVAAVVICAIVGWLALGGAFLSESVLFGGLMLLWYWATIEQLAVHRLLPAVLGALIGIALAWGMYYGGTHFGTPGLAVGLLALVIAIYLDIIRAVPLVVNPATMLYSIVAAAPLIQLEVNWVQLCLATVGGGMFFGFVVSAVKWAAGRASA